MVSTTLYLIVTYFTAVSSAKSINLANDMCKEGETNCSGKLNRAHGLPLSRASHQDIDSQTKSIKKSRTKTTEDQDLSGPSPIITVDNPFPDKLNFFCQITNVLQRDRFCYGNFDTYLLACADGTSPLQLVPFCLGYHHICSKLTFPDNKWCPTEYHRYRTFCTIRRKYQCEQFSELHKIDLSCSCEPYSYLRDRYELLRLGTRAAAWCQRYELYCDRKKRTEESETLVSLLFSAVRVHKECLEYLNIAGTICIPFKPDFDHGRCIKFLFDCELILDFSSSTTVDGHFELSERGNSGSQMEHDDSDTGSGHHFQ